jgi:hypothetical protein
MDDDVFVVVVSTMNFCVPQDNRASGWVCIVGFSGEKHEQALEIFLLQLGCCC